MKNQETNTNTSAKIYGTVTNAPEVKVFETGKVKASCRLVSYEKVINETGELVNKKVWRNVVAWGKSADYMSRNFAVGRRVSLDCTEKMRTFSDTDGKEKKVHEFILNRVLHLGDVKATAIKIGGDC
ncbi:MAG: single-stranded DNA-binding protein [Bacteroidia bacterium]|nr:single-stranded DNA-binding protein [Bacteroidia bacterium]